MKAPSNTHTHTKVNSAMKRCILFRTTFAVVTSHSTTCLMLLLLSSLSFAAVTAAKASPRGVRGVVRLYQPRRDDGTRWLKKRTTYYNKSVETAVGGKEDFRLRCEEKLRSDGKTAAVLSPQIYARFLFDYCRTSSNRGPACGDDDTVQDLDVLLQSTYDLGANGGGQDDSGNLRKIDSLCESSYILLESKGLLVEPNKQAIETVDGELNSVKEPTTSPSRSFVSQEQEGIEVQHSGDAIPTTAPWRTSSSPPSLLQPSTLTPIDWDGSSDLDPGATNMQKPESEDDASTQGRMIKMGAAVFFLLVGTAVLAENLRKHMCNRRLPRKPAFLDGCESIISDNSSSIMFENGKYQECGARTILTTAGDSKSDTAIRKTTKGGRIGKGFGRILSKARKGDVAATLVSYGCHDPTFNKDRQCFSDNDDKEQKRSVSRKITSPPLIIYEDRFTKIKDKVTDIPADQQSASEEFFDTSLERRTRSNKSAQRRTSNKDFSSVYGSRTKESDKEDDFSRPTGKPYHGEKNDRTKLNDESNSTSTNGSKHDSDIRSRFEAFDCKLSEGFDDLKAHLDRTDVASCHEDTESNSASSTSQDLDGSSAKERHLENRSHAWRRGLKSNFPRDEGSNIVVAARTSTSETLRNYFSSLTMTGNESKWSKKPGREIPTTTSTKDNEMHSVKDDAAGADELRKYFESLVLSGSDKKA
jgi:hypothetical protein